MPRGGRPRLTDADIALWLAVAGTVRPREGARLPDAPAPPAPPRPPEPVTREPPAPFLPSYTPPPQPRRAKQPPLAPLEKRYRAKVARGRIEIDRAIDLHGLNQPQAHTTLIRFLHGAAEDGARLVLVVTGKGRGVAGSGEPGVLRRAVPHWLRDEALRPFVMGFEEASLPHGGFGALYVRLRRRGG